MSAKSRNELLLSIRPQYLEAAWREKKELLDGFIAATGYSRKHAITLLSSGIRETPRTRRRNRKYDDEVREALVTVWKAANRVCSKRLVPFLPSLVASLERFGHLTLPGAVKERLLSLSPSTADRLLKAERRKLGRARSTTRPGHLIKKQIPVRTFADWSDVRPGFFEADLVAHCGNTLRGQFLNTLTMTDIATGWTELMPLLMRSGSNVLAALSEAKDLLPFPLLGFDTDNGGEFINEDVLKWCSTNKVTFTRSREYRKNDQAHVEEKNGSIVRRLIGYERYEGIESWQRLSTLYRVSRLYVNFFQPCLKLVSKDRDGARVRKRYERAQTPYERVLRSNFVSEDRKVLLQELFDTLDPLLLLKEIERMQSELWNSATTRNTSELRLLASQHSELPLEPSKPARASRRPIRRRQTKDSQQPVVEKSSTPQERKAKLRAVWSYVSDELSRDPSLTERQILSMLSFLNPAEFDRSDLNAIGTRLSRWRKANSITLESLNRKPGRKTALDELWHVAVKELDTDPILTASQLLSLLCQRYPDRITRSNLTTVKHRLKQWRAEHVQSMNACHAAGNPTQLETSRNEDSAGLQRQRCLSTM